MEHRHYLLILKMYYIYLIFIIIVLMRVSKNRKKQLKQYQNIFINNHRTDSIHTKIANCNYQKHN